MEAATERKLESAKAQRIIDAMRSSVARRGAAASTFDEVAQEAGVSRGLLHYYFGSKERLLVEVVRRDCELRMELLEKGVGPADSIDAIVEVLVGELEAFLADESQAAALVYELWSASRHNDEIGEQMADLYRRVRAHMAGALEEKERAGVLRLRGSAEAVSSALFALADGIALQVLSDPEWDPGEAIELASAAGRFLLEAGK